MWIAADPTGGFGWITSGGLVTVVLFLLWAFLLKNPPLFVSWREHVAVKDDLTHRLERAEDTIDRLTEVGAKSTSNTERVQDLLQEALEEVKRRDEGPAGGADRQGRVR